MALSVRARILLGFGLVLLMLVASAAVSTMLISGINTHFDEFQHALERKTEALKLELVMTETRVRVNQWLRSMNPFFAKGADDLLADSGGLLDQARAAAVNDQERETISGISRAQTAYIKSWHVVQQLYADGVKVYAEKLDAPAAGIRTALARVRDAEAVAGGVEASRRVADARDDFLTAEAAAADFQATLGKDDASKVNVALIAALAALDKAGSVLKVAGDAAALKQSQTAIAAWHDAFAEIVKIVETRVARINSWTKDEGEVMAKGADALRAQAQLAADRAQGAVNATVSRSRTMLLVSVAIILLIGIALSLVLALSITRPLARMTGALKALAGGNRGIEVPETLRRDEIGAMAKAAQVFKENLIEGDRLREDQAEAKRRAEAEKRAAMQQLADEFEATVTSVVDAVSSASNELQATAQSLSSTAEETSRQSTAVAAASEQASANVHQVATAAEELSSSIAEIGRRVGDSARIADQAKGQASETNAQIQSLAEAAQRIGDVVKLITEIASQTNLLALNATIEASRAGEAGKGFAVVASEVKSLANQTAKATEDIKTKIAEMQAVTGASVTAVHTIAETIARIDQITTMIASAVEQQGAATMEIARNVQQASDGTAGVTSSISSVRQAASDSGAASSHVLTASSELARNAETLRGQVDAFVTKVRTA